MQNTISFQHGVCRDFAMRKDADSLNSTKMVTNTEEIDLTLKLYLDKPHTEMFLTTSSSSSSSSIGVDISESLVGNGASGGSSVSSLYKPSSLPLKSEKIEFQDLQTMIRSKDVKRLKNVNKLVNVGRLVLQKHNKVEAAKIKKETSPTASQPPPSEVIAGAAASVSKNPAFIRALAQIKEDMKLLQDMKHRSARGLAKGGASSRFLRSP
ncbi:uncharacterized protein LOC129309942 [Prosopis cineraria]|uniref:uncharacterized protein LOC129309942 n=1 Tax=Prosopis cineraria TaxID=364024 RepID=UPI00240ED233|nr:uncharacterized protein LOC129309942 [Prosopis cineraria]